MDDKMSSDVQVEHAFDKHTTRRPAVTGTARLLDGKDIILVPTPSPDPNDPLNLPAWRKWAILILVSAYGCVAVVLASGLGPIFTSILAAYPGQEQKANDLQTYPTLFMGIGNLLAMPLALTIGRRPIFLFTLIVLIAGGIWCAYSKSLESHIAGRAVMSLAAGQSEALAPMIVQEIFFLHERGRKLAYFIFIETVTQGAFFIISTYMVSAWGWRWWYGFFSILNAVVLALSFIFLTETFYNRPDDAPTGEVHLDLNEKGDIEEGGKVHIVAKATTQHGIVLEPERFGHRTWKRDLRIFGVQKPDWSSIVQTYLHIAQGLCVPSLFWLMVMNGAWLGIYVFEASTFATILIPPPYNFGFNDLGPVQAGQVVACFIFLPLLGYGSDFIIKIMSKRNGGVFKPEYRLLPLVVPAIVGVVCAIVYGQAAQHRTLWPSSAIIVPYNASFFAFLGANLVGITYAVESFPLRAAPVLVVLCAGRRFISFGLSYATLPAIQSIGYSGAMNAEGIIAGVLSLMAIPIYFLGPKIRVYFSRVFSMGGSKEMPEQ